LVAGDDGVDAWSELMRARESGDLVADGIGFLAGGQAEAGYGAGVGYQGSSGVGICWGDGLHAGGFTGNGSIATIDPAKGRQFVAGGGASAGVGAYYTNATSFSQLQGPFRTTSINLWIVSFQYASSNGIYVVSFTWGPGVIAGVSSYNVETVGTVGK
jgi:hypothetical protein